MADEVNPAVIKRTQDTLGKYVKKPNLTEKLLKKPPFRFLHDIFSAVIKDTGCFSGLYSSEELTYENIKDRDDKMKFLQKMIDVVKLTTGSSLSVRTSKIVAGHEPEKTNELLQLMGEIIDKKLDWKTAVEQVQSGKTPNKESPRKSKDSSNKPLKDSKSKDKSKDKTKEKDSKIKDSKTTKTSTSKIASTANKDEKQKVKTKDKVSTKSTTKEKTSKSNKEPDKPLKKSTKESSNSKAKLTKSESQTSNKSSPTPTKQESKDSITVKPNEAECNHDEEKEVMAQSIEKNNQENSNRKLSNGSVHNEISNQNETVPTTEQQDSLQSNHLDQELVDKPKKSSAKSRKSSARSKLVEGFGEKVEEKVDLNNLEKTYQTQEKYDTSEAMTSEPSAKQETLPSSVNKQQQQSQVDNLPIDKTSSPPPKIPSQPTPPLQQKQPSPPVSLTNEMKRESTFTRENSKESSSNQSSLNRPRTSLRPPSARPPSARPGAPRRRDKNIEIILQPNDQVKMSGIQVKLETFGDLDDDGENLVIIENPNANDVTNDQQTNLTESEKLMQDNTLEQGHLVQQILETQKELVQQPNDLNNQQKSDKDSTNGLVLRQTSARHMNNLRDVIQNLTKSINPLGKLMDFIPEDIDAMQLEFTMWRDAYTQAANELKREKSLTESATEPMKNQLIQIEANIQEYMEMIDASRVKILQNSEKILKMLTTS